MIPTILAQIGLPILTSVLAEALGAINSPVTQTAAKALAKVEAAISAGQIDSEQLKEANRHAEKMAEIQFKDNAQALVEINKTLRSEAASEDKYVRRMRPTFGYLMALTWAAQMFGIAYVIVFDTARAGAVMAAMSNLSAIWAVGLSVMGIYVYKRSEEKKRLAGPEQIFWNS